MAAPTDGPSLRTTAAGTLAIAVIFGALGGWLVVIVAEALDLVAPVVPWTAPLAVLGIAAGVGMLAYTTHQRVQVDHAGMEPQRAVAFLVLGKASALAGALVAGGYLSYAVQFLARLDAVGPRDRVLRSAITVGAGIGLCIAGLLLERACKVPSDADGPADDDLDADPGAGFR